MRRARIVVDAERQAGCARDRDIVLKRFFVGQRRIGDGSEKKRVRPFGFSIAGEVLGVVGAQRAHPDDERSLAADRFHGCADRATPFCPCQIGIRAGAS